MASRRRTRRLDGIPALYLHGLGGDLEQLWGTGAQPRTQLSSVIATDARLHGWTSVESGSLDFEALARDQLDLLRAESVNSAIVVGVSMDAATALRMYEMAPEAIRALVLVRPAWTWEASPPHLDVLVEVGKLLERLPVEQAKSSFADSDAYRSLHSVSLSTANSVLAQFDKPRARERSRRLREIPCAAPLEREESLGLINVPVTVLGMDGDPLHPISIARRLAQAIPGAELSQLPPRDRAPQLSTEMLDSTIRRAVGNVRLGEDR